jgi:hypothetical protein
MTIEEMIEDIKKLNITGTITSDRKHLLEQVTVSGINELTLKFIDLQDNMLTSCIDEEGHHIELYKKELFLDKLYKLIEFSKLQQENK